MRVLVTGGTGYLGRAVVGALVASGHDVVLYGRTASASGLPAAAIDGDIRDAARLCDAAKGCGAMLHSAALVATWTRRSRDFDDVNVGGLRAVLDAAGRHGIGRVLYTSSFLALPPAGLDAAPEWNDYQRTKAAADVLADAAVRQGSPIVRLYPGVIYGPGAATEGNLVGRMVADHLAGRLPGVIGGDRIWSFSFVEDVAPPQMRVFDIVRQLTGRPRPRSIPGWLASPAAFADELTAVWFRRTPLLTTGTLEILLRDWPLGHARATEDLGYRVTPLEEGVARVVETVLAARAPA
jgi:farnesol dehydrogenase